MQRCLIHFSHNSRVIKKYEGVPEIDHTYRFVKIHEPIYFSMGAYVTTSQTQPVTEHTQPTTIPSSTGGQILLSDIMLWY